VIELFEYALRNCEDSGMVGVTIRNEINVQDKAMGISFRRKDQSSNTAPIGGFGVGLAEQVLSVGVAWRYPDEVTSKVVETVQNEKKIF
jgi:hypothetical protein